MNHVLALHGVATDPALWSGLPDLLPDMEIRSPLRARSGDLETEVNALVDLATDGWVIGQSGGATLGLALTARTRLAGAVLHEPAVGSLLRGLLAPMRAAYDAGGSVAFAHALYGSTWVRPDELDDEVTGRELDMFASFEPTAPILGQGPVVVTYGALSPSVRRDAAHALGEEFGLTVVEIPGTGHDVAHQNLPGLVDVLRQRARSTRPSSQTGASDS